VFTYFDSRDGLTVKAATVIAEAMQSAVDQRDRFLIALSGGSTPRPVYERLASEPYGDGLPWDRTQMYFGDERMVPPDNEESNYRMVCEALLDRISIPPANIHRIEGEHQAGFAADQYDRSLARLGRPPQFDLILLGLGPDGHTASLFPGTGAADVVDRLAIPVHLSDSSEGAEHAQDRVTMTLPVINSARHILFLVAGADKADALRRVQEGDESAPASRVRPVNGTIEWMIVRS